MGEIKWIKIATNIFSDEKIKMIKSMPGGKDILFVWFQLLALAGRTNKAGAIYFTPQMPYSEEMLSIAFDENIATIKIALNTFTQFGMIEIDDDRIITILNWEKHQNVEGMEKVRMLGAERAKRHRDKQKQILIETQNSNVTVTPRNGTDIDIDLDKELNNITQIEDDFNAFWNLYNKKIDRKKSLDKFKKLRKQYSLETILEGTTKYLAYCKIKDQFIKNPLTFLNGENFNDEYDVPGLTPTKNEPPKKFSIKDIE